MLSQLATSIHPTVMATMENLYSEITHPFVQEANKAIEWTHASAKSTHNSAAMRRDTTTTTTDTAPVVTAATEYVTDYATCWYSSTNDIPYTSYWANKAQEKAEAFNACGTCAASRIKSLNYAEQRFEYNRLGSLGWPTYTGESFYAI